MGEIPAMASISQVEICISPQHDGLEYAVSEVDHFSITTLCSRSIC